MLGLNILFLQLRDNKPTFIRKEKQQTKNYLLTNRVAANECFRRLAFRCHLLKCRKSFAGVKIHLFMILNAHAVMTANRMLLAQPTTTQSILTDAFFVKIYIFIW